MKKEEAVAPVRGTGRFRLVMTRHFTLRCFLVSSFFIVLFVGSCMTVPETKIYSLYLPSPPVKTKGEATASLAMAIDTPKYLSQSYIGYRSSPYELDISRYSKWEAPPAKIIEGELAGRLMGLGLFREIRTLSYVPTGFYSLKVNMRRFEMLEEGTNAYGLLHVDVEFMSPEGKLLYGATLDKKTKLADNSFKALAIGLSELFNEMVNEITGKVAQLAGKDRAGSAE